MEVHSSDAGGNTDRNSNYPRCGKLHLTNWQLKIDNWKLSERGGAQAQSFILLLCGFASLRLFIYWNLYFSFTYKKKNTPLVIATCGALKNMFN